MTYATFVSKSESCLYLHQQPMARAGRVTVQLLIATADLILHFVPKH
jgi:hypothetical protein